MVRLQVDYLGDLRCRVRHPSGAVLETDAPLDNLGKGEGFSPTDLVVAALAACIATTMAIVADRMGVDLKGMTLDAEKGMADGSPRRVGSITVIVGVGADPGESARARLERAAAACPVHRTLSHETEIPLVFRWGA